MNWRTIGVLIRREYLSRVRRKSFAVMTFLIPALMAGTVLLPIIVERRGEIRVRRIAVADETGMLADSLRAALGEGHYAFFPIAPESAEIAEARQLLRLGAYDALVVIPSEVFAGGEVRYVVAGTPDPSEMRRIREVIGRRVIALRLWRAGFSPEQIGALLADVPMRVQTVQVEGARRGEAALVGAMLMGILMYFTLALYGVWTMRGVLDDKLSHVVEVLLSASSPVELMIGKIVGIGAAGLTQVLCWLAMIALVGAFGAGPAGEYAALVSGIPAFAFLLFYLTGYMLFATVYAAIGAASPSSDDATQLQWPVLILLIIPVVLLGPALADPDRMLIVALSYVPYFAPVLMLLRLAVGSATWMEAGLALALIVGTAALSAWGAARLFRVGILMTGKRPSPAELWRWLREG